MKREKGKRVYIYSYAAAAAAAAFGGRIDATNKIEEEEEEWKGWGRRGVISKLINGAR